MARPDFFSHGSIDKVLMSAPVKVHFAGWTSDTHKLQRAGWDFVADQNLAEMRLSLMARHRGQDLIMRMDAPEVDYFSSRHMYRMGDDHPTELHVRWVKPINNVLVHEPMRPLDYHRVDMTPQVMSFTEKTLDAYKLFAPAQTETREIIVEPKDVQECLNLIERLQAPQLAEIRRRNALRESSRPIERGIVHAQVIALAA